MLLCCDIWEKWSKLDVGRDTLVIYHRFDTHRWPVSTTRRYTFLIWSRQLEQAWCICKICETSSLFRMLVDREISESDAHTITAVGAPMACVRCWPYVLNNQLGSQASKSNVHLMCPGCDCNSWPDIQRMLPLTFTDYLFIQADHLAGNV